MSVFDCSACPSVGARQVRLKSRLESSEPDATPSTSILKPAPDVPHQIAGRTAGSGTCASSRTRLPPSPQLPSDCTATLRGRSSSTETDRSTERLFVSRGHPASCEHSTNASAAGVRGCVEDGSRDQLDGWPRRSWELDRIPISTLPCLHEIAALVFPSRHRGCAHGQAVFFRLFFALVADSTEAAAMHVARGVLCLAVLTVTSTSAADTVCYKPETTSVHTEVRSTQRRSSLISMSHR